MDHTKLRGQPATGETPGKQQRHQPAIMYQYPQVAERKTPKSSKAPVIDLTQSPSPPPSTAAMGSYALTPSYSIPAYSSLPASSSQSQSMYGVPSPSAKKGTKRKAEGVSASPKKEKRLRRFRPSPPSNFNRIYGRALTQRFFVLSRKRCGTHECPEEKVEMTGSTGNIYTIHITQSPTCTCPHARQGNQCKHWLYVMSRVLRAPFNHVYQLALIPSELREIFAGAPPIEADSSPPSASKDKSRKPVEGDCLICFTELDTNSRETIVWCSAACGQNIHRACFETWAKTKRQSNGLGGRGDVTCPFCRSVWEGDEDMVCKIKTKGGAVNSEGYVNVADQLGISAHRDTSAYYMGRRRSRSWRDWTRYAYEDEGNWDEGDEDEDDWW